MAKTMTAVEAKGLLNMAKHEGMLSFSASTYRRAVESVAMVLRPRFESGELVPWKNKDPRWEKVSPIAGTMTFAETPNGQVEAECRRLFIRRPTLALLVTEHSPSKKTFDWERDSELPLVEAAKTQMAQDVLALAKRRGWLRAA